MSIQHLATIGATTHIYLDAHEEQLTSDDARALAATLQDLAACADVATAAATGRRLITLVNRMPHVEEDCPQHVFDQVSVSGSHRACIPVHLLLEHPEHRAHTAAVGDTWTFRATRRGPESVFTMVGTFDIVAENVDVDGNRITTLAECASVSA